MARYEASGLTQRVFAQEEGIGVSTLQLWLRQRRAPVAAPAEPARSRTKRAEPPAAFSLLEVELADGKDVVERAGAVTAPYELVLARGTRLRLAHGFTAGEVRLLLALLEESGC